MSLYVTILEADTYFSTRLRADRWNQSNDSDKTAALTMACDAIDVLNFVGQKTDDAQEREFPRGGDTDIPEDIKKATYNIAAQFLDDRDMEIEIENLNIKSKGTVGLNSDKDILSQPPHIRAGIPSIIAWNYLKKYLRDPLTIDIKRV